MEEKQNRVKGSIVGFAIGDAIGGPVEFKKEPKPVTDFQPAHSKGLKPGQYTDDTQHLLISIDSLLSNYGAINLDDISRRLRQWYGSGEARSIGRTTEQAIQNLRRGIDPRHSGINNPHSCGSLAIPRLIPYCLLSALLPYEQKLGSADERRILGITHAHPRVAKMGSLVHYYVQEIMHGKTPGESSYQIVKENEFLNRACRKKLEEVIGLVETNVDPKVAIQTIGESGFVEDVVYSAIYSAIKGKDFRDSVLIAANGFGDADSRASLTGALKGLELGYSSIPEDLRTRVENASLLESKAKQLYDLAISRLKL